MTTLMLENDAWTALERIYDPCSVATRSPLNIVDMGLVREVAVDDDGNVRVSICPTAPSCMLMASISGAARKELRTVDGLAAIDVRIDSDFFWTPEAMTEKGEALLARYRAERLKHAPRPLGQRRRPDDSSDTAGTSEASKLHR
jgi:metal-sulfur cluster biosynthetic enzyme